MASVYQGAHDCWNSYGRPIYVDGEMVAIIVDDQYGEAIDDAVTKQATRADAKAASDD